MLVEIEIGKSANLFFYLNMSMVTWAYLLIIYMIIGHHTS